MKKFTIIYLIILLFIFGGCNGKGDIVSSAIGTVAEVTSQTSTTNIQAEQPEETTDTTIISTQSISSTIISTEEIETMLATEEFHYTSSRDPFSSPLQGLEQSNLLNPKDAILEGVISGPRGFLAIIRSQDGKHWLLRRGDRVSGGNVAEITPDAVTFVFNTYGTISKVVITKAGSITGEGQ